MVMCVCVAIVIAVWLDEGVAVGIPRFIAVCVVVGVAVVMPAGRVARGCGGCAHACSHVCTLMSGHRCCSMLRNMLLRVVQSSVASTGLSPVFRVVLYPVYQFVV